MYRQNRYDACIKEVKSKLKKFPNSLHLLNYQAMAYSALKRDKEALESYQKIIKKDPSLAGPYYNMGIILKRNGRVEEAIDSYNKLEGYQNENERNLTMSNHYRALANTFKGDFDEAAKFFRRNFDYGGNVFGVYNFFPQLYLFKNDIANNRVSIGISNL